MESELRSVAHKSLEEITERFGDYLNDETRSEILGEKIYRHYGSGTGKTLVKLCLVGDVLRIATDSLYADGVVSQDELGLLFPLLRECAALLPHYRSEYKPFADLGLAQAAEFLRFYKDDTGVFGHASSETRWAGLDICCNMAQVYGDASAINQYESLAVDVTRRLSAVDGIADAERECLKQIKQMINERRLMLMRQNPANKPPHAVSHQTVSSGANKFTEQSHPVRPRRPPEVGKKAMAKESRFDVYKEPLELSLDKIGERRMITILAGGIINA